MLLSDIDQQTAILCGNAKGSTTFNCDVDRMIVILRLEATDDGTPVDDERKNQIFHYAQRKCFGNLRCDLNLSPVDGCDKCVVIILYGCLKGMRRLVL